MFTCMSFLFFLNFSFFESVCHFRIPHVKMCCTYLKYTQHFPDLFGCRQLSSYRVIAYAKFFASAANLFYLSLKITCNWMAVKKFKNLVPKKFFKIFPLNFIKKNQFIVK